MTCYLETRRAAHVVEWVGKAIGAPGWRPLCGLRETIPPINGATWPSDEPWPVYNVLDGRRRKPWCQHCVRLVRAEVERWTADVLVPAEEGQ